MKPSLTPTPASTKRVAVVYRRVSYIRHVRVRPRTDETWSLQSQDEMAAEYAARHGLMIVRDFEEVASASTRGRPVFAEMVAYLGAHPETVLVVEKMDRLARNRRDLATVDDLIDAGVEIHLVRGAKILSKRSSPAERFISDVEGAVATHYARNLGRDVKKGIDARFAAGYFPTANPPYGYVYPPRRGRERVNIVPDPKAAKVVRMLFQAYATGDDAGFLKVIDLAQQLGYRHSRGSRMSPGMIRKLLTNPTYVGWIRHNGELIRGLQEPLIEQSLFDQVQARMAAKRGVSRAKLNYAFIGIFACAHCGGAVSRQRRGRRREKVFWCCRRWCDQTKYVLETDLITQVCMHLDALRLPKKRIEQILVGLSNQASSELEEDLLAAIRNERQRRARMLQLVQDGDVTKEELGERLILSEQREHALQEHLAQERAIVRLAAEAVDKQLDLGQKLTVLFACGTGAEQRRILALLWETTKAGRSKLDANYGRIEPNWRPMWRILLAADAPTRRGRGSHAPARAVESADARVPCNGLHEA